MDAATWIALASVLIALASFLYGVRRTGQERRERKAADEQERRDRVAALAEERKNRADELALLREQLDVVRERARLEDEARWRAGTANLHAQPGGVSGREREWGVGVLLSNGAPAVASRVTVRLVDADDNYRSVSVEIPGTLIPGAPPVEVELIVPRAEPGEQLTLYPLVTWFDQRPNGPNEARLDTPLAVRI